MSALVYGVYPHATDAGVTMPESRWHVPGYVVRQVSAGLPYGRLMPLRQYVSHGAAQRFADKLNARHERGGK